MRPGPGHRWDLNLGSEFSWKLDISGNWERMGSRCGRGLGLVALNLGGLEVDVSQN